MRAAEGCRGQTAPRRRAAAPGPPLSGGPITMRVLRVLALLLSVPLALPALAADAKKADKKKPAEEKKATYIPYGRAFVATIVSVENDTVKMIGRFPVRGGVREQPVEFDLA